MYVYNGIQCIFCGICCSVTFDKLDPMFMGVAFSWVGLKAYLSVIVGMEGSLMLLCSYQNINTAYNLRDHGTFADFIDFLCSKFSGIGPRNVGLSYNILGLKSLTLQDDVDLGNLVILAQSFGLQHVCVLVEQHGSCGVSVRTSNHPRVGSDMVADIIAARVRDRPLIRSTDVILDLKDDYGLDVNYRVAWLGVEKAMGELFGAHSVSFDQLRWYCEAVMQYNPGSYVDTDYDEHNYRFCRFFISFKACIDGFLHCRPLLFLDGTFLKGRFKGFLLAATAKDGNQGLFPLVYAIVDSENNVNWGWFLQHLANVVPSDRTITFVSDRNDKLRYVNSMHRIGLVSKFCKCAYAPTITTFNQKADKFQKSGKTIATKFLADAHPQHWANAFFKGRRYGEISSNAAESFNSWIREARYLPITRMVDSIKGHIMRQMSKRMVSAHTWTGAICPKMESRLEKDYNKSRAWKVSQANNDVYEVHSFPFVMVDIGRRTCSCFQWQINEFPCAYAIVAVRKSGKNLDDIVIPWYHVSKYRLTYAPTIYPIPTVEKPPFSPTNYIIYPPNVKHLPGRPKKKRIPSKSENVQQIRCERCSYMGNHNRKTCKEPI
ncbi:uncharacterized protein LOC114303445 [Camellia sinensis]|uniref:uncharacterized protein LOC114303445 n=1 Tax=Camellia sinensis TaxID=4442 RepID=UPI0010366A66|nr:uncharacterized protein LOC114303445 [Camellia sinensis]